MSVVHSGIVRHEPRETDNLHVKAADQIGIRVSCQAYCMGHKRTMRLWQIVDEDVHLLVSATCPGKIRVLKEIQAQCQRCAHGDMSCSTPEGQPCDGSKGLCIPHANDCWGRQCMRLTWAKVGMYTCT